MKNPLRTLLAVGVFGAAALGASAQPALKLVVVDMAKLYDTHYKTVEQNAKLQADDQKANEEVDRMNKEGNALVEEYKGLKEQSSNPALTAEAKTKAEGEAQKKLEAIQQKQNEVRTFIENTRRSLQQRLQSFRSLMLDDISKIVVDLSKRRGATLVVDKAGPSIIGIPTVIYSDPGYDITEEVSKELNKDRPAGAPTAAPAAPAAAAPAGESSAPRITVPGVSK